MKNNYTLFTLLIASFYVITPPRLHAQTRAADSTALVAIYNGNGGSSWTNNTNWLSTQPLETWYGIHTSASGRVDSISLSNNNLVNSFPTSFIFMDALAKFDFSHNSLTGNLPYFQTAAVVFLDVSYNQLTGGLAFYNLPNVLVIHVNNNQLSSGSGALGLFPQIKEIYASHNSFNEPLPGFDGTTYDTIDLSYNQLTGSIGYYNYPAKAKYFNLNHNNLSGSWGYFNGASTNVGLDVSHNKYTFNELEPIISNPPPIFNYAPQDTVLPAHFSGGKLSVTAGGTLGNDTYKWYKSSTLTSTVTGDSTYKPTTAGKYSAAVTDAAVTGLTLYSDTVTVVLLSIQGTTLTQVSSCGGGSDGSIRVNATGGSQPYQYKLTKPDLTTVTQSSNTFTNLPVGTYSVTVTDNASNTATTTGIVLTQAAALAVTPYPYPVSSCGDGSDGKLYASTTGGVAPLSLVLSGAGGFTATQAAREFNNLAPGTYSLTITDNAGCGTAATGITIAQAAAIAPAAHLSLVSNCGSGNDGSITVGWQGGVWPFEFTLTEPGGGTVTQRNNPVFGSLAPGTYGITMQDTDGCVGTQGNIVIGQAAALQVTAAFDPVGQCGTGTDGKVYALWSGGVAPFNFTLNGPGGYQKTQATSTFSGLAAGTYGVSMVDAAGCTGASASVKVWPAAPLTLSPTIKDTTACHYNNNENLYAGAHGGTSPFTYTLITYYNSVLATVSTGVFNNVNAGTYTLVVQDASGCTDTATGVVVPNGPHPSYTDTSETEPSCITATDGSITVGLTGGTAPYVFYLENSGYNVIAYAQAPSSTTFTGLAAGSYILSSIDANTCSAGYANVTLSSNVPCPGAEAGSVSLAKAGGVQTVQSLTVSVLPNPSHTAFTLAVASAKNDPVEIVVTDMYGHTVHHAQGGANRQYTFGDTFAAGVYIARVMQNGEAKAVKLIKQ